MNMKVQFFMTLCMVISSLKPDQDRPLTLEQSIFIGSAVGAAEVALPGHLLSYAMNVRIEGTPFVRSQMYKGILANIVGQMPITAVQKVVQVKGSQLLQKFQQHPLSERQKYGMSFLAGVCGALIDTPCNAIQLYLQDPGNAKKNTWQAGRALGSRSFRGFAPNAFLKEGPFAVGYQVLAPKGKEIAQQYIDNDICATVAGGAPAGVFVASITQTGAVMRNKMQKDPHSLQYITLLQTVHKIVLQQGRQGLIQGIYERGGRVAVATDPR